MPVMKTLTINGRTYTVTPVVPTDSVTLSASAWVGDEHEYSQVVELSGVTPHTKVDLQPTSKQLVEFHDKVLGFVAENDGGLVTVFAIGDKPTNDHTIQVTLTEVESTGKIRGNTVGTTMPQSDWSQTDPTKADYIKNKPTGLGGTGDGSGQNPTVATGDITSIKTVLGNLMTIIGAQVEDENGTPQGYNMDVSGLVAQNNALIAALGTSDDSGGSGEDNGGDTETSDGVSSINYTVSKAENPYEEPDNGYVITTSTAHTATSNTSRVCAWKLISGKTYNITVTGLSNAYNDLAAYYWLKVSTLDTEPVKGEVTAVTDTVVKAFAPWNGLNEGKTATFTYTAGAGEYLLFRANELGLLNITAEVTA